MGRVHIENDFKDKLNKVLTVKSEDTKNGNECPVGPASKWKMEMLSENIGVKADIGERRIYEEKIVVRDDKKNLFEKMGYLKFVRIIFVASVVGGVGLTLGLKIGHIIFF